MKKIDIMKDRKQIIKEFKTKHKLNIFTRNGEIHYYGTEADKIDLIKKLNNIKN